MKISLFVGDIADAPADAVCTSTNARLSLMMGSGGAIRERGGFEILRECEDIVARSGKSALPVGSVHVTSAGRLPFKLVIHCVASDPNTHLSSAAVIRACVKRSLAAASAARCRSIAMPVFATGHARFKYDAAVATMIEALREAETDLAEVLIVVHEPERADGVRKAIESSALTASPQG
jgi:O-acetyl-ADP-ribose deacetylase